MPDAGPEATELRWVNAAELTASLTVEEAADALEATLAAADPLPYSPQRSVLEAGVGQMLSMPSAGPAGAGAKLVTVHPGNPDRGLPLVQATYVLFEAADLSPAAVLEGAALTSLRTAAVSVVATRALCRADARNLVIFGAGTMAHVHALAMCGARPIEQVTIVSRSTSGDDLARELRGHGIAAARGPAGAVTTADLICTCTTAADPLFPGDDLRAGVHINCVGSYQPHTREVDSSTVGRAAVFIEDAEAGVAEAGDLKIPIAEGRFKADRIAGDLRGLVRGRVRRLDEEEITLFKSVGLGWQDIVVAQTVARKLGIIA